MEINKLKADNSRLSAIVEKLQRQPVVYYHDNYERPMCVSVAGWKIKAQAGVALPYLAIEPTPTVELSDSAGEGPAAEKGGQK
jgi:hypothetical protein